MSDELQRLRAQHDALQASLGARKSTEHFTHGAVGTLVGVIAAVTAVVLWLDGESVRTLCLVSGGVAGLALSYAAVRWVLGARALRAELAAFAELRALRSRLGLDDPRALLPV